MIIVCTCPAGALDLLCQAHATACGWCDAAGVYGTVGGVLVCYGCFRDAESAGIPEVGE